MKVDRDYLLVVDLLSRISLPTRYSRRQRFSPFGGGLSGVFQMSESMVESHVEGDVWIVKLNSATGESVDFPEIPDGISALNLNLDKLHNLNSMGIRDWFLWMKRIEATRAPTGEPVSVSLNHVGTRFLRLVDVVFHIIPESAKVESFYISCSCLDCPEVRSKLVQNSRLLAHTEPLLMNPDLPPCAVCGFETELELSARFYGDLAKYAPD